METEHWRLCWPRAWTIGPREQACFLECAVWPEDVPVSYAELELFWGRHAADEDDRRDVAGLLVDASVLQPGSGGPVQLHDLYQDYLRHLAGERLPAMHGELVDRCVRFTKAKVDLLERREWVARFLPWHLLQSRQVDAAIRLLIDFEWLAFKLERVGIHALIGDTSLEILPPFRQFRYWGGCCGFPRMSWCAIPISSARSC